MTLIGLYWYLWLAIAISAIPHTSYAHPTFHSLFNGDDGNRFAVNIRHSKFCHPITRSYCNDCVSLDCWQRGFFISIGQLRRTSSWYFGDTLYMFVKFHPECAMYGTYLVRLSSEKSHWAGIAVQPSPTEDPKTPRPWVLSQQYRHA